MFACNLNLYVKNAFITSSVWSITRIFFSFFIKQKIIENNLEAMIALIMLKIILCRYSCQEKEKFLWILTWIVLNHSVYDVKRPNMEYKKINNLFHHFYICLYVMYKSIGHMITKFRSIKTGNFFLFAEISFISLCVAEHISCFAF